MPEPMRGDQPMEEDKDEVNPDGSQKPNLIGNEADQAEYEEPVRLGVRSNLSAASMPMRDTTNTFPQPQHSQSPNNFGFAFGQRKNPMQTRGRRK